MNSNYLLPNACKRIGWLILLPSVGIGLFAMILDYEPRFLDFTVPTLFPTIILGNWEIIKMTNNNLLNELLGIIIIISSIWVAFSKEVIEDEFIQKIRLESLVWATYVNYGILIASFILFYEIAFFWVLVLNMFTLLWFFIIKFNIEVSKLKKGINYEELD